MFYCQLTKKLSKSGEHPAKLVTHIRNKTYYRVNHKTGMREISGQGTEIVKEVLVLQDHYNKLMAEGFLPEVVKEKQTKEHVEQHATFQSRFQFEE